MADEQARLRRFHPALAALDRNQEGLRRRKRLGRGQTYLATTPDDSRGRQAAPADARGGDGGRPEPPYPRFKPMSVAHGIARHLAHLNGRNEDDLIAPWGVGQVGIAGGVGVSRAHAAIELKRMMEKGFVEASLRHVENGCGTLPTRRKTYRLTRRGLIALALTEGGETCPHLQPQLAPLFSALCEPRWEEA